MTPLLRRLAHRALATLPLLVAPIFLAAPSTAQEASPQVQRPKKLFLRDREDWSVLRDVPEDQRTGTDAFKYVPFGKSGKSWATFAAWARMRVESWTDFNFGAPPGADADDVFSLFLFRASADIHFDETWRVFLEGKSALATDRDLIGEKRPVDEDPGAIQQLFVDGRFRLDDDTTLTVRPGRQMLQYGKQRLVSPLPWANALRAWDGVSFLLRCSEWAVDGFFTRFVPVDPSGLNTADDDNAFYGLYATRAGKGGAPTLDLYWLGLHNDMASFNGSTGTEDRQTLGARVGGRVADGSIDYDVELAVQVGTLGGDDIRAGMMGAQVGYNIDASSKPRVWLGFDYGSGDDDPTDGESQTFNQLYPLGHAYLGLIDVLGRQNVYDVNVGGTVQPVEPMKLTLANHAFWVPTTDDALYNVGGAPFRGGGTGSSSYVGYEIDLTATWRFNANTSGLVGYSHFFAGDLIDETGPSNDIDFFYVSVLYAL